MDRIRLLAAFTNASLVLGLYTTAWGAPTSGIAVLELALAAGAGISTWYALRGLTRTRRRA
jgi:hypothetical protein